MTRPTALLLLAALSVSVGCTMMGTGFGSTSTGGDPVDFTWTSADQISGTMTATLRSGKSFSGNFFQITSNTKVDRLGPLWAGWDPGWRWGGGWNYWNASPDFVTHYSGRVVANLTSPDGHHIRCTFQLIRPSAGMSGGGAGQCQMPTGLTIDTTFPAA